MNDDMAAVFGTLAMLANSREARKRHNQMIMNDSGEEYSQEVEPFDILELQEWYARLYRPNGAVQERQRSMTGPCFCGSGKKLKHCHRGFHRERFILFVNSINSITCLR